MKDVERFMHVMTCGGRDCDPFDVEQDVSKLKEAFAVLDKKNTFSPGDIVEWKPGLKNKATKGPFVIVSVLGEPPSGIPYFREPLDIVVGQFDKEGNFDLWHLDSRRLQPYKGE